MKPTVLVAFACVCCVLGCQDVPQPARPPGGAIAGDVPTAPAEATAAATTAPSAGQTTLAGAATRPAGADRAAERFRLVNGADEIVSVLDNGLTVIAKRVASPVVSVRGYALTGGVYEGKWLGGGLSHLLEHLVAGGTNDRRTEAQNRDLLQKLGNNSNAYTTTDHTCYFVNTTTAGMADAVDLVTGWMFGAAITPEEYRREYEVVQRELEMGKGEPDRVFEYLSDSNRYRVSPARVPVIGYQEVIQGLSRDDVYAYYKLAYQPNNMVFALAGDLPPEEMLAAVRKNVSAAEPGRVFSRDIAPEPPVLAPRTVVATFPKLGQARLRLAFPSIRLDSPDLFALDLLAQVLGGGDSSVLVDELRDRRQLVSAVSVASATPAYAEGAFEISMELDPDKIAPATAAVLEQLAKVENGAIDAEQVRRAKTQMRATRVKQTQTSEDIASSLATDFITAGDPHFSDRYVRAIQEVTPDALRDVARKYFDRRRLLTTAILPAEFVGARGLPKAEDLLRAVAPITARSSEASAAHVTRSELPDGTVLLVKRISTSPLVVMNLYTLGGLTAEDAKTNGLGNLTMAMLPRGTTTRSAREIAEFFDSIGGDLDTGCGNNAWYWNATCLKDDFEKAFEAYADVVNNPAFPDAEVEPMKRRVLAEIAGQDADWTAQAFRFYRKSFYGPMDSPYQFPAIGTEENVTGFKADDLRRWYDGRVRRGFGASGSTRRVLAVFGDVDPENAKGLAAKFLAGGERRGGAEARPVADAAREPSTLQSAASPSPPSAADKPSVRVERVEVQKTEQALAGVVIGYKSNSVIGDPANNPLVVADAMSSGYGYPTGYLFEILRGRGLVYTVHAQNVPGLNPSLPGSFLVYAGCDPKNVNEVVDVILENIARLQGTPADVNEDWFGRSKEMAIVGDAMDQQTPAEQAAAAATDELYGLGYDHHTKFAERVRGVTLPSVRDAARSRLAECVVTVSTPAPDLVAAKPGRREYDKFPPVDLTPRGVQHAAAGSQ